MRFGSVCSGIEAASVAWECLGWSAAWFAEIEAFPSAVLAHHWPDVPNLGDMTTLAEYVRLGYLEAPDVLVGGTPCQAFSVAGARKSLDDERGQLSLEYIKLANAIDSQRAEDEAIIVWENVPGVLNTKDNAFGCFLGALAGEECPLEPTGGKWPHSGCVFGPQRAIAWRVLDAQYFGVAQRRLRVFVVASARKGFDPSEILFELDSMRRDTAPSRETGQNTAAGVGLGFAESSFGQFRETLADGGALKKSGGVCAGGSETLIVGALDTQCGYDKAAFQSVAAGHIVVHGTQDPLTNAVYSIMGNHIGRKPENGGNATEPGDIIAPCLTKTDRHAVAYSVIADVTPKVGDDICMTLRAQGGGGIVPPSVKPPIGLVRRLTPRECERLQGFPDDHTRVPYRGKAAEECPDGPRYAACGNSMAVPVMRWIGSRIDKHVNTK